MKIKVILSFIFSICSFVVFAQENEKLSKWSVSINYGTGNSTLKHNELGLLTGHVDALLLGVNYRLSEKSDFFLSSGLNMMSLKANYFNGINQSVINNVYFQIPFAINDKWMLTRKDKLYTVYGIGLYVNYLGASFNLDYAEEKRLKNTGFNLGSSIHWGFGYQISDQSSIDFGVNLMKELDPVKRNGVAQTQLEVILVQLGYCKRF